ncbi:3'(2'),5'-bisphosphate nucleotidase CysQ [Halocynthiibacter sp. C4]|uniref:3'(2'),5'-bisphosphate nucleotidase CysQ n=1 Tax=Halocynthiibacter sp. C4 TaxID=2992758 RepID=UPI00237B9500|nr:3'(2'),5'-bisphosphate nucleotidase CysQ [Halocynthiibacter sp. C4]MDE0591064.1 3'(2'),5'-bisphosphate nucleotidase CysQ [Halocynthiibacter sp. C4]
MPESDLDLLIDAAKAAGEIAGNFWKQSPEVWDKSGGAGPVTEADIAIDKMLNNELLRSRPDYGWLSEEIADSPDRLSKQRVFIVDPIDGTRAFINGSPTFSHSLAVADDGVVTAAVVYLPMLGRLYSATIGDYAKLNGEPIRASSRTEIDGATALCAKSNFSPERWIGAAPNFEQHIRSSLAYRLSLIAQGRFDVMLTLRDTWEWDVAAGSLIAERAGSTVTDMKGNAPIFNNPTAKLDGMIAAPSQIHREIVARLAPR